MKLTERCFKELELGGGRMREIAARLGEDECRVRMALCNLRRQKRIMARRLDCERRVYFYFLPDDEFEVEAPRRARAKPHRPVKRRIAGHVYFGQMKW